MRNQYINWKKQGYDDLLSKLSLPALAKKINHENPGREVTVEELERRKVWLSNKNGGPKKAKRSLLKRAPEGSKFKYEEVIVDNAGFITRNNISYCLADFCTMVAKDNWEFVSTYRARDYQKAMFRCPLSEDAVALFPKEKTASVEESITPLLDYLKNLDAVTETTNEVAATFLQKAKLPGFNATAAKDILFRLVFKSLFVLAQDNLITAKQQPEGKKRTTG